MTRTWLITGASSGLGAAIAEHVLARGHRVVATARRTGPLEALSARAPDRVLPFALDFTDAASIE